MSRRPVTDRDAIVSAAAQLFEERGYRNTTIEDIARHLGIAKPTVYAYIESKTEVLEAIFERLLSQLLAGLRKVADDQPDPVEATREMIRFMVGMAGEYRSYFMIFFSDERELEPRTRERFRDWARQITDTIETVVRKGIAVGSFTPDINPKIAAYLLTGMVTSVIRWFDDSGTISVDGLTGQIEALISGFIVDASRVVTLPAGTDSESEYHTHLVGST